MLPYICDGTIVKTANGREGRVIGIDRQNNLVTIHSKTGYYTEKIHDIEVVSYKGVE
jgi:hypothetical protein